VASIWVESLGPNFRTALDLMEAAVQDCADELWHANMWEVPVDTGGEVRGPDGNLVTDPAKRHALAQRYGQPWYIAWHALQVLDANLTSYFVPWEPWSAFGGKGIEDTTTLSTPWSRVDLLGYSDYCRQRVVDALGDLTDERAATPIGRRGQLYVGRLIDKLGHVIEHGSQIRQFVTAAGVAPATREKVGADVRIKPSTALSSERTQG
jgi:hypothetical protein